MLNKFFKLAIVGVLTFTSSSMAKDWSKQSSWLSGGSYSSDDAKQSMRSYYSDNGYKSKKIGIVYSNEGGYVVKAVKVKIKRKSDNAIIYSNRRTEDLDIDSAHVFLISIGLTNKNEELKMTIDYTIAGGGKIKKKYGIKYIDFSDNTRTCTRTFTYKYKDVMWMTRSKGSTTRNNGCHGITFQKK